MVAFPFLCQSFLVVLGKLLWPFIHAWRRVKYLASFRSSKYSKMHSVSDEAWTNIKAVEYGVESSLQLFLQLWLLNPFLAEISIWSPTEVVVKCVTGLANFVTFDTYPACYLEKALGKILLTVISFSLGVAQMKSYKPGQGYSGKSLGIISILFSILAQTIARTFAIKSLILMKSPGFLKYAIFFFTHYTAVFAIKILCETQSVKEKLKVYKKDNLKILLMFIASGFSSTIVMIHLRHVQPTSNKSHFTFLSHSSFFILILIENIVLVTFPYFAPDLYPVDDCFTTNSRSTAVWIVVVLWFVGVICQIIYYKMAHDWSHLNGPKVSGFKLEFDFMVPWSKRNRSFSASHQGFKCKKVHRNNENSR
jgi:hypothetical protein